MKQRLGIAFAIFNDPQILILDEPVNGLDPSGIREVRELLKRLHTEHDITIFLSSHLLSEIEKTCTHIGIIQEGRLIFQGDIDSLMSQSEQVVRIKTNHPNKAQHLCLEYGLEATLNERKELNLRLLSEKEFNQMLSLLITNDIDVYRVEQSQRTLEDLFISLTKH